MMSAAMAAVALGGNAAASGATAGAVAAAQADPTSRIINAYPSDLDELDPHYFKSIPAYHAMPNLYDNLFAYDYTETESGGLVPAEESPGNWKLLPWLLESWEVSEDKKTLTFGLRTDLVFSDGSPLTAKDVKATWDRGLSDASVYSKLVFGLMTLTKPEQITTPDDHTVVVRLEQPTVFALKMIATNVGSIMSAASVEAHKTAEDPTAHDYHKTKPFGSGPYVLSKWTPGVEWEFAPNPNFWNKDAIKNGGVLHRVIPSAQERLSLLQNGDIDVAYSLLPKDLGALRDNPDIALHDFTVPRCIFMQMNNTIPPFDNVEVRRAVSHAIPYQTLIDEVMFGFAGELKSPIPNGMPTSDYSFWKYDGGPAKTMEMLEAAGVADLSFELVTRPIFPEFEEVAVWIQSGLAEAGVNVTITKMTEAQYLEKFVAGQLQAALGEWYSWINDPIYHLKWNFQSTSTATNGSRYNNPRLDEIVETGMYEADTAKRDAMAKEAQQIIVDEAPWAFLYTRSNVVAARKNITGVNTNPDEGPHFWMFAKA
jgi:peptide/nickel transport system substrate-binding protein